MKAKLIRLKEAIYDLGGLLALAVLGIFAAGIWTIIVILADLTMLIRGRL